jgi:hypothetical protein
LRRVQSLPVKLEYMARHWSACLDLGQMRREKISLKEHLDGAEAIYA